MLCTLSKAEGNAIEQARGRWERKSGPRTSTKEAQNSSSHNTNVVSTSVVLTDRDTPAVRPPHPSTYTHPKCASPHPTHTHACRPHVLLPDPPPPLAPSPDHTYHQPRRFVVMVQGSGGWGPISGRRTITRKKRGRSHKPHPVSTVVVLLGRDTQVGPPLHSHTHTHACRPHLLLPDPPPPLAPAPDHTYHQPCQLISRAGIPRTPVSTSINRAAEYTIILRPNTPTQSPRPAPPRRCRNVLMISSVPDKALASASPRNEGREREGYVLHLTR